MSFGARFPGFRLRLTRWGALFLVAMLVLGAAAVNTGNNALMTILGLALGSFVVSGTWSRQVLGKVAARAHLPREVFAGRPTLVELELVNRSRLFPAYGLVVRGPGGRPLLVEPFLRPRASRRHPVEVVFPRRGWTDLDGWRLEVLLPLGFFLKSKQALPGERLIVYPRLLTRSARAAERSGGERSAELFERRGREGDVTQLRDFRPGDDQRQIHWKQSARQQRLIAVDRQHEAEAPAYLVLDPRLERPEDPEVAERFEHLVSEVATEVVARYRERRAVGLVVGAEVVPPVRPPGALGRLLRPLAEVRPVAADGPPPVAPSAVGRTAGAGP